MALRTVGIIFLTLTLVFFLLRILPGDAVEAQLAQTGASMDLIDAQRSRLGLDQPAWNQYRAYVMQILRGDLGQSLYSGQSVVDMLAQRLPNTLALALSAGAFGFVLGLPLGLMAVGPRMWNTLARLIIDAGLSVPVYWTGTLVLFVLLPYLAGQRWDSRALLLPALVLGFHAACAIARVVFSEVTEIISAPFITTAHARGLKSPYILRQHVLVLALPPVITVIGLQLGFLMSGTVIIESIFNRPGIGQLLLDAVIGQDYPVVQGVVIVTAAVYTILNTLADFLQRMLDPRLQLV